MNRINQLFAQKKHNVLSIYYTAGFPNLEDTMPIAQSLEDAGVDMLEIGFPYSDPVADGPVLQESSKLALENGMSLQKLFDQLKTLRPQITIPVLLMGYVNPVLQYGVERFCASCAAAGVDGCIIPDLPLKEYQQHYQAIFEKHGLSNIFLVTPNTAEERIREIDHISNGFVYLLSSAATTGKALQVSENTSAYFSRIQGMKLKNPLMVGFGIGDKSTFHAACNHASGAIVGTAFVKTIKEGFTMKGVKEFIEKFK